MADTVVVEKQKLKQLIQHFHDVCGLCEELNIGEFEEGDESMQEMKDWVDKNFGDI